MADGIYSAEIVGTIEIDPELKYEIVGGWIKQQGCGTPWPYAVELRANGKPVGRYETREDAEWGAYEHMAEFSRL